MLELLLLTGVVLVMFGLVASTEKVLQRRQSSVKVIDERMTDHRSRL